MVDVSKFLYIADPNTCKMENVTSMESVVRYLNQLREHGVGPSGQKSKLSALANAMKMVLSGLPDDGGDEETKELVVKAKVVETELKGITQSLRKESGTIRLHKREMFEGGSEERDCVLSFLENKQLKELVQGYVQKDSLSDAEQLLARRFLMCFPSTPPQRWKNVKLSWTKTTGSSLQGEPQKMFRTSVEQ